MEKSRKMFFKSDWYGIKKRADTKDNISLLKSHLISETLAELESGFHTKANPIGARKKKKSANDFQLKNAA